ncbi:response regulator [Rhodopseudomonas sp. P2A-2r]|uniref:response regulator n=1 Tax=unclassified Rhodopseudomonas TaxID=2638247 RepID=UPI0022347971|nr:response regulator [Rhodopseudomonas sp. P2A-2r]UZE49155.1 response regulator [Rhodopseudomonas sp. P2A-2r]
MVYVVDDDVDVLKSLRFLLETEGFDVRTFGSGAALLDNAAEGGIDCLVIDYKMPDIDGIELAQRLRQRSVTAPVVLITGYPDEQIQFKASAAGIARVLLKPHIEDSLVRSVCDAMQAGGGPVRGDLR